MSVIKSMHNAKQWLKGNSVKVVLSLNRVEGGYRVDYDTMFRGKIISTLFMDITEEQFADFVTGRVGKIEKVQ
jgi:hypothetical protein